MNKRAVYFFLSCSHITRQEPASPPQWLVLAVGVLVLVNLETMVGNWLNHRLLLGGGLTNNLPPPPSGLPS